MCNLDDYADVREVPENEGEGQATIAIAKGTPAGMTLKVRLPPRVDEEPV